METSEYNCFMESKVIILKSGRKITRYKAICKSCNADRGYKDKNKINTLCVRCSNHSINSQKKGIKLSEEHRKKISLAAYKRYNDSNWKPKDRSSRGPTDNSNRTYDILNNPKQRKLKHNMKTLLNVKLKRRNMNKNYKHTFDLLGYSIDDLIFHLESQFQEGMTWANYGEWHIDHIKPDSWFNYSSTEDEDFKKSWSLQNLQPLWAKDNLSKGARNA